MEKYQEVDTENIGNPRWLKLFTVGCLIALAVFVYFAIRDTSQSQNDIYSLPLVAITDIGGQLKFTSESSNMSALIAVQRSIDEQLRQKFIEGKKPTYESVQVTIKFSKAEK